MWGGGGGGRGGGGRGLEGWGYRFIKNDLMCWAISSMFMHFVEDF